MEKGNTPSNDYNGYTAGPKGYEDDNSQNRNQN